MPDSAAQKRFVIFPIEEDSIDYSGEKECNLICIIVVTICIKSHIANVSFEGILVDQRKRDVFSKIVP